MSGTSDWWRGYDEHTFHRYLTLESEASALTEYETSAVPGLLQTEEYAYAIIRGCLPLIEEDALAWRVRTRMHRQERLRGLFPLRYWALLDESVIHRHVGGRDTMRHQLERVIKYAELPNVTIQLVPFSVGAHVGFNTAFQYLEFDSPARSPSVWMETLIGYLTREDPRDTGRFREALDFLQAVALSPADSLLRIAAIGRTI